MSRKFKRLIKRLMYRVLMGVLPRDSKGRFCSYRELDGLRRKK